MTELEVGSVFAGHRVDAVIAREGMGVVYRATHLALNRRVALKVIAGEHGRSARFRERFEHELQVAASLHHPHVIPIYDAGDAEGVPYVTMLLVEGTDVGRLVRRHGAAPPATGVDLVAQVAEGLDAAHERGLLHQDVKPANVLVAQGSDGARQAYLTDFGMTRVWQTSDGSRLAAGPRALDCAAPEQLRGDTVDPRTDVYALGCVLHIVLTGRPPFPRESAAAAIAAHLHDDPPSAADANPKVPPALDAVVGRALAKDPDDRFTSAGDLGRAARAAAPAARRAQPPPTAPAATAAAAPAGPAPTAPPGSDAAAAPDTTASATKPDPERVRSRRPRRAVLLGGVAALALVAGCIVLALVLTSGGEDGGSAEPSGAGEIVRSVPLPAPPSGIVATNEFVFVANRAKRTVTQIDAESMEVVREIRLRTTPGVIYPAPGGRTVWIDTERPEVVRYDVERGTTDYVKVPSGPRQIAADDTAVWLLYDKPARVTRVDAADNRAGPEIVLGTEAVAVAAGGGRGYVMFLDGDLVAVDGANGRVAEPVDTGKLGAGIIYVDGALYAGALTDNQMSAGRVDLKSGRLVRPVNAGQALGFTVHGNNLWALYTEPPQLRRFDLRTARQVGDPLALPSVPDGFAPETDAGLFLAVREGGRPVLVKIEPAGP